MILVCINDDISIHDYAWEALSEDGQLAMGTPFKPILFSISTANHCWLGAEYFMTTD